MNTMQELEEVMTKPSERLIEDIRQLNGDIMILGIGGKMGPSMAKLAKRAIDAGNLSKRVIGVSRFSSGTLRTELEEAGIETISADLLREEDLQRLPEAENMIYMAGHKFGTTGNEQYTWAMNTYLPGRVAERFPNARHVVFSTGNVYPLVPLAQGGCDETHPVHPVGEYAQSCLGRERIYSYFSRKNGTPVTLFRLNYAIDMKYGVLLEIAKQVYQEKPVDVRMGHVNVIWQGDANEYALRSLLLSESPPAVLNITGPETVSIRWLAQQFAARFNKPVTFVGEEQPTALLNNSSKAHHLFGYPSVSLNTMIGWTADWIKGDGQTIDKPTHFQERQGAF
ncbi:NAD-dependent epimerase/dehydratase family protein [Fictibacillus enclensis]|uniref:NAD-dependent epimerase/dehydratase family protein n=1 Tax=Fictibacillus enclensis TaxID=1017270 RepID=UPI0025A1CA83|nr:NAD-dependent epimerase/dehydratase family protein [Fictibacillus enclensis]MDM5201251.1 NAD-dependent epimerase/dehydratase family protein [Fictibacillus enclensis]